MIVALQDVGGEHLGFVLFANESKFSGDCIVRALPMKSELFDSSEFKLLASFQDAGEFNFELAANFNRLRIYKDGRELLFERTTADDRLAEKLSGLAVFA